MKILKYSTLFAFLFLTKLVLSNEIIVTSTDDTGSNTFREAVTNANSGDTIIINVKGTITLSTSIVFNQSNLTIIGPYPKHNTFTSSASTNMFFLPSTSSNITFIGLGFKNANVQSVIFALSSSQIFFKDCLFENNVCSSNGTLNFTNTEACKLENCSFINNYSNGNGGAIYVTNVSVPSYPFKVVNCTFYGNNCSTSGGAIYLGGGSSIELYQGLFKNNSASSGGQAIEANNFGRLIVRNTVFTDNGGGNQLNISGSPSSINLNGNLINLNSGEINPFPASPLSNYSFTSISPANLYLKLIEDGYGLKYFRITSINSPLVDKGYTSFIPNDCRRAPRIINISGVSNPFGWNEVDIGPVEYTPNIVTNTNLSGTGSLLNAVQGGGFIEFDIPSYDPQTNIIQLSSPIQLLFDNIYIDGYSQPGTSIAGPPVMGGADVTPADSLIRIVQNSTTTAFEIGGTNPSNYSTITGLEIYDFSNEAINVINGTNFKLFGCHIGFFKDYTNNNYVQAGNEVCGVKINDNLAKIGGAQHWQRNVITGNGTTSDPWASNIFLDIGCNQAYVKGNFIGVLPTGNSAFGFGSFNQNGIALNNTLYNDIGGVTFGTRNIISGNSDDGIAFYNLSIVNAVNLVSNNYIGLGYDGVTNIGNQSNGIEVNNSISRIFIGSLKGNVISGNQGDGIHIENSQYTQIENNIIGLAKDTSTIVGNLGMGVNIVSNSSNVIVGSAGKSNLISGNLSGVNIDNSNLTTVGNNIIGLDGAGTVDKGNSNEGIYISNSDSCSILYNTISGNDKNGILIDNGATNLNIYGNYIGLDASANSAIGNSDNGIYVLSNTAAGRIGRSGDFNIISANGKNGINTNSSQMQISGNIIGLNNFISGITPVALGNVENGVYVSNQANNLQIDGDELNYISANASNGVFINGADSVVIGNCIIGTNDDTLNFGNAMNGIYVLDADSITIGTTYENMIGWVPNTYAGILLENTYRAAISNNFIGVKKISTGGGGMKQTPNTSYGVHVIGYSENNSIGVQNNTKRNFFGNNATAISLDGSNVQNNVILSNLIGFDIDNTNSFLVPAPNDVGIEITNNSSNNNIGKEGAVLYKNFISSNTTAGIYLKDGASNNKIYRNLIGSDTSNTFTQPNGTGIFVENCSAANYIGGTLNPLDGPNVSGNYYGIVIQNSSNQEVKNCRVGSRNGGTQPLPNTHGIVIQGSGGGNIIGGTNNTFDRNLISGNDSIGVAINNSNNNVVVGNIIGANLSGNDTLPNLIGVYVNGGSGNIIGQGAANQGNLISGNTTAGVILENNPSNTIIKNNLFGTDNTGNAVLNNATTTFGVLVKNTTTTNTIGGDITTSWDRNVFANQIYNIGLSYSENQNVEGNYIGVSKDGSSYLGNNTYGVYIKGGQNNIIGNTTNSVNRNVITNCDNNIFLDSTTNNQIANNYIGNNINANGIYTGAVQGVGIRIDSASTSNTIGPNNIISGNNVGVRISGNGTNDNVLIGNHIGVDYFGNAGLANDIGVVIAGGAKSNIIGGVNAGDRNIVSGNNLAVGVGLSITDAGTDNNKVINNYFGLGVNGTTSIPNVYSITIVNGAQNNLIGGSTSDSINYMCNDGFGISINSGASNNYVRGNKIGRNASNFYAGIVNNAITIDNANNNVIGGLNTGEGNLIVNSGATGIVLLTNANNNKVLGNSIYDNGGLAIDINNDGPTPDNTTGIQSNVQMPEIIQAFDCNGGSNNVQVGVVLEGLTVGNDYIIEFYDNTPNGDPSGYGEAKSFIERFTHTALSSTDTVAFSLSPSIPINVILSASLTSQTGGTSEMSANYVVTTAPTAPTYTVNDETCNGSNDGSILVTADSAQTVTDGSTPLSLGLGTNTATFNLSPGTYNFTLTYYNGCTLTSTQTINNGPTPGFTYTVVDDTCGLGGTITLIDTTTVLSGINQYSIDNGTNYLSNNSFTNISANTYNAIMTITTNGQLCSSNTLNITVNAVDLTTNGQMDFDYGVTVFCASNSISPIVLPTFSNGSFNISPMPSAFNSTNATISGAAVNQEYIVVYSYGNCQTDDTITAIAPVDATFSYDGDNNQTDSLCLGDQTTPQLVNPNGIFNIFGSGNPTITVTGQIIAQPGMYNVEYITSNTGCPDTANVTVTILNLPPSPNISTSDTVLCPNEYPQAIVEVSGLSVNWTVGSANNPIEATNVSFTPSVSDLNNGNNYIFAYQIDNNGCSSLPDSINLYVSTPNNLYADSLVEICLGSEVELFAYNGQSYLWSNNTGIEDSTDPSIIVSPNTNSYYHVSIYDGYGCVVYDSVYVVILDPSECHIDTYTAFSPNGDNVNDTWIIDGIEGFKENIVYIYNRWGDLIKKIENYDNSTNVWDGSSSNGNTIVSAGTYFYIVEANGTKALSGWVQIVK